MRNLARHRCLPTLILLNAVIFAIPSARAGFLKRAEVTAVVNEVNLVEPGKQERLAGVRDVVQGESSIKTGVKSRAELLFQDKTLTRLGANTLFSFDEGTRDLELAHGTMLLQAPKGIGGARIRTAAVTAAITGTTILLEYTPVPWTRRQPPGVSPLVATMTPEQCAQELQHPRRKYAPPDHAELERKARLVKKGGGFVKVMVLEGTLRLFLNNRVGESVLVSAGNMIILNPSALSIPPSVEFDIARLAQSSLLVNNKFWGGASAELSMALVSREITAQEKAKKSGDLSPTGLRILGGGINVIFGGDDLTSQLNRAQTAMTAVQPQPVSQSVTPPSPPALMASDDPPVQGNEPPSPPPFFAVEGSAAETNDEPPETSSAVNGNVRTLSKLDGPPGSTSVLPQTGSSFTLISTAGAISLDEDADPLAATKLIRKFDLPAAGVGGKKILSFDYRFLTDEIGESGSFGDRFDVRVESSTQSLVYTLDRDVLDPGGADALTPLAQRNVGGFKGGTAWLPFALDLTPFAGQEVKLSLLVYDRGDPVVDTAVALGKVKVDALPASSGPGLPGRLSFNLDAVVFGDGPGETAVPNMEGLSPLSGTGPAADVGSLTVTSPGAITLNAPLLASTGANGSGATFGGKGGSVSFVSTGGEIAINSTLKVSESSTTTGRASASGGSITLTSARTTGVAISVSNSGELLALVNALATPGSGGQINLTSQGGEIQVKGKLDATSRGKIEVVNYGASGLVQLTGAQLAADIIKVGALGDQGVLRIGGGSMSADTALRLYAGGSNGTVDFVDNVTLSGNSAKTIAASTVNISDGKVVTVNGPAAMVFTDHANYTGSGGNGSKTGTFGNAGATTQPFAGKPSF